MYAIGTDNFITVYNEKNELISTITDRDFKKIEDIRISPDNAYLAVKYTSIRNIHRDWRYNFNISVYKIANGQKINSLGSAYYVYQDTSFTFSDDNLLYIVGVIKHKTRDWSSLQKIVIWDYLKIVDIILEDYYLPKSIGESDSDRSNYIKYFDNSIYIVHTDDPRPGFVLLKFKISSKEAEFILNSDDYSGFRGYAVLSSLTLDNFGHLIIYSQSRDEYLVFNTQTLKQEKEYKYKIQYIANSNNKILSNNGYIANLFDGKIIRRTNFKIDPNPNEYSKYYDNFILSGKKIFYLYREKVKVFDYLYGTETTINLPPIPLDQRFRFTSNGEEHIQFIISEMLKIIPNLRILKQILPRDMMYEIIIKTLPKLSDLEFKPLTDFILNNIQQGPFLSKEEFRDALYQILISK